MFLFKGRDLVPWSPDPIGNLERLQQCESVESRYRRSVSIDYDGDSEPHWIGKRVPLLLQGLGQGLGASERHVEEKRVKWAGMKN